MKPYSILFGLKSVIRRKQRNFFGIIAIALGVSLITGVSITNQSLGDGFGIFFTYSLGSVDGSVTYSKTFIDESIANSIGSNLTTLSNVTAFTTELSLPVTTSTQQGLININSVLKGININDNPSLFGRLIDETSKTVNVSSLDSNEVFVGKNLATELKIHIGDKFNYSISLGPKQIEQELTVKDVISNEQRGAMANNNGIFIDLKSLQAIIGPELLILGFPVLNPVTVIYLRFSSIVKSVDDGKLIVEQMKEKLKNNSVVALIGGINTLTISTDRITIKDYGKSLADALGNLLSIFGSILIIAGLILIVNIQLMTIENREKQIGIQRAVGTKNFQIIIQNLTEFIIVGLIGGFIGIFGGFIFGLILIQAFGYSFGFNSNLISVTIPPGLFISAFVIGLLISILAGLYPSIRASRINVIEVIRGLDISEFKPSQGSGIWGFTFGLLLTILGLLSIMNLSKNPLDFPNAYRNVTDAESIYLASTILLVGLLVLLSYFVSKKTILSFTGLVLIAYPVFQLMVIFNEIKEGSGGTNYILVMTLSLIGGSILLVSLNLDTIANISEKIFSIFFSAISMISFRQMASQKTRSTLTFAIFAFILSLNIFLASWAYSDRYGAERQVNILAGDSDIMSIAGQPLFSNQSKDYITGLENTFPAITHVSAFPDSGITDLYLNNNATLNPESNTTNTFKLNLYSVSQNALMQNDKLEFNFLLAPNKLNTTKFSFPANYSSGLETDGVTEPIDRYLDSNIQENVQVWKFFASGAMVTNITSGKALPVIITSDIANFDIATQTIKTLKNVGDSVWLPLKNGTLQEFVIMAISPSNPLFDSYVLGSVTGAPSLPSGAFIQEKFASQLAVFNITPDFNKVDMASFFVASTSYTTKSDDNNNLASNIEAWSNGLNSTSFRTKEGKLFGFLSVSVYSIYETSFDGQFRVLQFMQYFTTLGFLFGIISLLVVSVRSVQERKREIGMMRSIGVKKHEVVISLIFELSVMGIIGLLIGFINGNLLAYGLVKINSGGLTNFLIPWDDILIYTLITLGSALFASLIPGRIASQIPPSDALRYTG